jgi:hypothetical protein
MFENFLSQLLLQNKLDCLLLGSVVLLSIAMQSVIMLSQ